MGGRDSGFFRQNLINRLIHKGNQVFRYVPRTM